MRAVTTGAATAVGVRSRSAAVVSTSAMMMRTGIRPSSRPPFEVPTTFATSACDVARPGRTRRVTKTVSFANGGEIPVIGFGTWQITGQTCVDAVHAALRSDYRHVDTATMYGNGAEVGAAWQDSGVPRDDIFLTTKLPPRLAGQAGRTLEKSLRSLGTDHVDVWLVHWPPGGADASAALWAQFIKARDAGPAASASAT